MTTYLDFYLLGAAMLTVGLLCEWRSEELTGRRFLARTLTGPGAGLLLMTLILQVTNHLRHG